MKSFKKNYIGKGKEVENLDIVRVTVKMEDLKGCIHKYKDEEYATFEVARMKSPDKFEKTHTVYYQSLEETEEDQN